MQNLFLVDCALFKKDGTVELSGSSMDFEIAYGATQENSSLFILEAKDVDSAIFEANDMALTLTGDYAECKVSEVDPYGSKESELVEMNNGSVMFIDHSDAGSLETHIDIDQEESKR